MHADTRTQRKPGRQPVPPPHPSESLQRSAALDQHAPAGGAGQRTYHGGGGGKDEGAGAGGDEDLEGEVHPVLRYRAVHAAQAVQATALQGRCRADGGAPGRLGTGTAAGPCCGKHAPTHAAA
jgi:hypothetical protein